MLFVCFVCLLFNTEFVKVRPKIYHDRVRATANGDAW